MNRPEDKARVALEEISMEAHAMAANYDAADNGADGEDSVIERWAAWQRKEFAGSPIHLRKLDAFYQEWREKDAKADRQVASGALEIRELVSVVGGQSGPAFFSALRGGEKVESKRVAVAV